MKNIFAKMFDRPFARQDTLPSTLEFTLSDGTVLTAEVRISQRARHIQSKIDYRGHATLVLPADCSVPLLRSHLPDIQESFEIVWKKYRTILKRQANSCSLPESIALPAVNETFHIKVTTVQPHDRLQDCKEENVIRRVLVHGAEKHTVLVVESPGQLLLMQSNDNPRLCARALQCWCRIKATCCLPAFLERLATKGGFVINNVSVRDQRGRWGSCSTRGNKGASASVNISLNWRTLLLPVPLLEHLCWHELCHLRHMDHSPAYHEELARFSPHWTQYEKALQNVWRDMPWWALPENGPATPPRR